MGYFKRQTGKINLYRCLQIVRGLIGAQSVREEALICFTFGRGRREGFTWEDIFGLHLPIRGDFQAKRGISVYVLLKQAPKEAFQAEVYTCAKVL